MAYRILSSKEALAFGGLTALQLGAVGALVAYWLRDATASPTYLLASILLGSWLALWEIRWLALPLMARPVPRTPTPGLRVAAVTTIVPSKEPLAMLETTVRALVAMHYPHDTWVLDEDAAPEVEALCCQLGAQYFTRTAASAAQEQTGRFGRGTKHGNYNVWLSAVGFRRYDILAAFDPDHVPRRDYLQRALGHFRDSDVAYVQPAPGFYNQSDGLVARGAAEETYTYWSVTVMAAYGAGQVPLNGSHNLHRVAALEETGGFANHDGDDHLLSLFYRANGWRGVYVPEHLALGTSPNSWPTYFRQQRRWARSLIDIKLRQLPRLLHRLAWADRAAALLHGAAFLSAAAIPLLFGIAAAWLATGSTPIQLGAMSPLIAASFGAFAFCEMFRQRFAIQPDERGFHWRGLLVRFAKWPYLVLAVVDALHGRQRAYELTDKVRRDEIERIAPVTHTCAAALIIVAWGIGTMSGGIADSGLHLIAAILVGISATVAIVTGRPAPYSRAAPNVIHKRLRDLGPRAEP